MNRGDRSGHDADPPPDAMPAARRRRRAHLVLASRGLLLVTLASSGAALVLPSAIGTSVAAVAVVTVVATPLLRVAWLVGRWIRLGDRRFGALGVAVLALGAIAALVPV